MLKYKLMVLSSPSHDIPKRLGLPYDGPKGWESNGIATGGENGMNVSRLYGPERDTAEMAKEDWNWLKEKLQLETIFFPGEVHIIVVF